MQHAAKIPKKDARKFAYKKTPLFKYYGVFYLEIEKLETRQARLIEISSKFNES